MLCAAAWACSIATPAFAMSLEDMSRMSEQLDQLDSAELADMVSKAVNCAGQRDFACAESQLAAAAKRANSSSDRTLLTDARQRIANEQAQSTRQPQRPSTAPSSGGSSPSAPGASGYAGIYTVGMDGFGSGFVVGSNGSMRCGEPLRWMPWFTTCTGRVSADGTLEATLDGQDMFRNFVIKAKISQDGKLVGTYTGTQDGRAVNGSIRGERFAAAPDAPQRQEQEQKAPERREPRDRREEEAREESLRADEAAKQERARASKRKKQKTAKQRGVRSACCPRGAGFGELGGHVQGAFTLCPFVEFTTDSIQAVVDTFAVIGCHQHRIQ